MKKGLLLSVVASTMIFAGGDISPVEPAAMAPAADSSDFYGSVGTFYQSQQSKAGDLLSTDAGLGSTAFSFSARFGIEKEIANGIGFGAESQAWSTFGWGEGSTSNNVVARVPAGTKEGGRLTQVYATGSFANTAIKAGRFTLPKSLSPYAYTDSWAELDDDTFEGGLIANTDLSDTTIYGVYVANIFHADKPKSAVGQDKDGLFAVGMVNKSLANTTITAVGYYANGFTTANENLLAGFATADVKVDNYKVALQGAWVSDKGKDANDDTFAAGAKVSTKFGMFNASLAASYINASNTPLYATGGYWLYTSGEEYTRLSNLATSAVQAKLSTKLGTGSLYGRLAYYMSHDGTTTNIDNSLGARIGYKFKVADIDLKAEYRYRNETTYSDSSTERHRVRFEAKYSF